MRKKQFLFFALISTFSFSEEIFAQELITTQGDFYKNQIGSISFSIGEIVTETSVANGQNLTQGFQQSTWEFVGIDEIELPFSVKAYPNPTNESLILSFEALVEGEVMISDQAGKIILTKKIQDKKISIDVSWLANGTYVLTFTDETSAKHSLKILKTN